MRAERSRIEKKRRTAVVSRGVSQGREVRESQGQTENDHTEYDCRCSEVTMIVGTTILSPVQCERWWRPARKAPAYTPAKVSLVASS